MPNPISTCHDRFSDDVAGDAVAGDAVAGDDGAAAAESAGGSKRSRSMGQGPLSRLRSTPRTIDIGGWLTGSASEQLAAVVGP